jgi:adenylate kinase
MKSLSYLIQSATSAITFPFVKHVYWRLRKPIFGVILGGPGSGKGTLAKALPAYFASGSAETGFWTGLLTSLFGPKHLSTGDVFRRDEKRNPELAAAIKPYKSKGKFVPLEITMSVLLRELKRWRYRNGAILDGFPRTEQQAQALDRILSGWGSEVDFAILLEPDEATLIERLSGRLSCTNSSCGRTYHLRANPPTEAGICDACKSPLYQREDDANPEVISERLKSDRRESAPIYRHYGAMLVTVKPAANWTPQEVLSAAIQALRGRNGRLS